MKKKFPKKAKLITDGGFYRIVDIDTFVQVIHVPTTRRIKVSTPEIDWSEMFAFELKFAFDRVYRGYAEYKQYDCIRIETPNH